MTEYIENALNNIEFDGPNNKNSSYVNSQGINVPRVTQIISKMIHNDGLMYWANILGFKGLKYREVLNNAAALGTQAHAAIELFLKDKLKTNSCIPFLSFMSWYDTLTQDLNLQINILMIEEKLSCHWFGGTLDCLMNIGGKTFLVDFKTSNHVTYTYFLQLAAYRFMLRIVRNINVDGVIVLQLGKEEPEFQEFLLDFCNPDHLSFMNHCEETFMSLVYGFYNITEAERQFKSIF